jgi:hypothetical protein
MSRAIAIAGLGLLAAAAVAAAAAPARAHGGTADGSRPFVTGIEPAVPGVAAGPVFAGSWEVSLSAVTGEDVAVLDDAGRPFLRFGPSGVEGDYGAAAWYASAVAPTGPGIVRLPDGIDAATAADWRPVARGRTWAWFDPRLRAAPGAVTPDMIRKAVPVRLGDLSIPLLVGGRPARITGNIEFEPPRGRYVHRLQSPARPAPGVEVGLLEGQAVPTVRVRNESGASVVVLGADGEPFLRLADTVEANATSPTWVQVGRGLGRLPKTVADPAAPPQWETVSGGHLVSWADVRSRPPDAEPQLPASATRPVEVRRWTIPLRIGDQASAITGATDFVPGTAAARSPGRGPGLRAAMALAVVAAVVAVAAVGVIRRRGSRSLR